MQHNEMQKEKIDPVNIFLDVRLQLTTSNIQY